MATMTGPSSEPRHTAFEEDLEAARTVSRVLFGVLAVGITIGIIGLFWSMSL